MRLCVYDFVCLSERCVRILSAPKLTCTQEECCLITMDDVRNLMHTTAASDGRTYDAIALHRWLRTQIGTPSFHVIPECAIAEVHVYPEAWVVAGIRVVVRCIRPLSNAWLRVSGWVVDFAIRAAAVRTGACGRHRAGRCRPMMFMRVVDDCTRRRRGTLRFRGARKIISSSSSAFDAWGT